MSSLNDFWTTFRQSLRLDTAHQLALGIAVGIWLGLIPGDSLLPYMMAVVAVLSPANLMCLALGWVLGAVISPLLDPWTSAIGAQLLTWDALQPLWATVMNWPMMSWTQLNNSVVLGNLVLGLIGLLPNYLAARGLLATLVPAVQSRVGRLRLVRWLFESDSTSPQLQEG